MSVVDRVTQGDVVKLMAALPDESADVVVLDPPYNIGRSYESHDDAMKANDYLAWSASWLDQAARILKPTGSLWLLASEEFACELKVLAQGRYALHGAGMSTPGDAKATRRKRLLKPRHSIVWYYTFGVNSPRKLTRSHTMIFHFVKTDKHCWNVDDTAIRVPSARAAVYNDKRANPKGRLPDDTWILRPQTAPEGAFAPDHDVWHVPRVCGTYKERQAHSDNQLPELLVERMLRLSTNPGHVVVDAFTGSGTVAAVAKKLGRHYIAFDNSPTAVTATRARLQAVTANAPIGHVPEGRKVTARRTRLTD